MDTVDATIAGVARRYARAEDAVRDAERSSLRLSCL